VIIGAGDHGRTALEILREASRNGRRYEVLGFLDDSQQKRGSTVGGLPVLGTIDWIHDRHRAGIGYVIGIADTRVKQSIVRRLNGCGLTFVAAVHPAAFVASGVRLAPGTLVNAGAAIAYDTVIEAHTTINLNATVGHDCVLGRFSTVAPGANIAGRVHLGEGCDIGLNATVGRGIDVGEWSSVGPGAVVIKDVAAGQRVFGNPARTVPAATTHA
jgi:sugar O-acyltransferase (sialic acid O-acetyltransferase NeuD family)